MLYGVHFFNELKGYDGLAIYDSKESAVKGYQFLEKIWNGECEGQDEMSDVEIEYLYQDAFMMVISVVEEIIVEEDVVENVRHERNYGGNVRMEVEDVEIVNSGDRVSIPA